MVMSRGEVLLTALLRHHLSTLFIPESSEVNSWNGKLLHDHNVISYRSSISPTTYMKPNMSLITFPKLVL
jgi:hypothetical protein